MIRASTTSVQRAIVRDHSHKMARWSTVSLAAMLLALAAILVLMSLALWRPRAHGLQAPDTYGSQHP